MADVKSLGSSVIDMSLVAITTTSTGRLKAKSMPHSTKQNNYVVCMFSCLLACFFVFLFVCIIDQDTFSIAYYWH